MVRGGVEWLQGVVCDLEDGGAASREGDNEEVARGTREDAGLERWCVDVVARIL